MTKFLCDVHINNKLVRFLNTIPETSAKHVNTLPNKWFTTDNEICKYADKNNYIVITKDIDFKNSHFIQKTPKKILQIVLGNISNNELLLIFKENLNFITTEFLSDFCYLEIKRERINFVKI